MEIGDTFHVTKELVVRSKNGDMITTKFLPEYSYKVTQLNLEFVTAAWNDGNALRGLPPGQRGAELSTTRGQVKTGGDA